MGLFDFGKKKEEKTVSKKEKPKEQFEIGSTGLIFDAKIQLLTNSKDTATKLAKDTIEHIRNSPDEKQKMKFHLLRHSIEKAEKMPNKEKSKEDKDVFGVLVEMRIGVKNKLNMFDFCFTYLPFFIEVVEPMTISFTAHELTEYATDIQSTIHNIDEKLLANKLQYETMLDKFNALAEKHNNLVNSTNRLLRNTILLSLKEKSKDPALLSKSIGIPSEQLKPFLDLMIKDKEISFEKNKYNLRK